jgi:Protein of unknown function (DUF2878)
MSLMLQNFILFQAGWFSCVIGGANQGYAWTGVAVVTVVLAVHLVRANDIGSELMLVLITMLLGTAWDSGLILAGLLSFENGTVVSGLAPYWLIAMWALFATTLNVSMKWMKHKYLIAALFGAAGGPIAYYAGHRIGAVGFIDTSASMLAVGVGWAVMMPLLMALTNSFNGYTANRTHSYEVKTS